MSSNILRFLNWRAAFFAIAIMLVGGTVNFLNHGGTIFSPGANSSYGFPFIYYTQGYKIEPAVGFNINSPYEQWFPFSIALNAIFNLVFLGLPSYFCINFLSLLGRPTPLGSSGGAVPAEAAQAMVDPPSEPEPREK